MLKAVSCRRKSRFLQKPVNKLSYWHNFFMQDDITQLTYVEAWVESKGLLVIGTEQMQDEILTVLLMEEQRE